MIAIIGLVVALVAQTASAQTPVVRVPSARPPFEMHVLDYGAACDGVKDDTASVQAAIDAAEAAGGGHVILPVGTCVIRDTIRVGTPGGGYSHINLIGQSEDSSRLSYTGPADRPAVFADHVSYYHWRSFSIEKANASDFEAHGESVGLLIGSATGNGTQSTSGTLEHVSIGGFKYGLVLGQSGPSSAEASEFTCRKCRFVSNTIGVTFSGYNSLNFWFYDLDLMSNTRGMEVGGDGVFARQVSQGPHVIGGATAGNTEADFVIGNAFDLMSIENVRAEPKNRFVVNHGIPRLTIRHSVITPTQNPDGIVIDSTGEVLLLEQNQIAGKVRLGGDRETTGSISQSVIVRHNTVIEGSTDLPVILPPDSNGLYLDLSNNLRYRPADPQVLTYRDVSGLYTTSLALWMSATRDNDGPPAGGLYLNAVRMLAFGTNAQGRNLRDQVRFAGAGTAALQFQRTIRMSVTGNSTVVQFPTGALGAVDVGKSIRLRGATTDCGYSLSQPKVDDVDARIVALLDDTHASLAPRAWSYSASRCKQRVTVTGVVDAVVGENEPDANYFLVLSCDSTERVAWADKTSQGFRLRSDNPTSRAVCDVLIVR